MTLDLSGIPAAVTLFPKGHGGDDRRKLEVL